MAPDCAALGSGPETNIVSKTRDPLTLHLVLVAAAVTVAAVFAPLSLARAEFANPHGVAVIIGNKTYRTERVPEVDFAHRDAEAFRRFVLDVLGFDPGNVIDLRDATQAQMEDAFGNERSHEGRVWRYLHPRHGSDVVVYYSGHGVPGLDDGRGYLLPVDAHPDSAKINGYPIDVLYANLGKLKAANSVRVYLDACFSGDSDRGMLIRSASPVYVQASLPAAAADRLTVLAAASGSEVASWDEESEHGLFTHHLLDALYGAGDADGDGRVTAAEAKTYLDDTMTIAARRTFGRHQNASLNGGVGTVLASVSAGAAFPPRPALEDAGSVAEARAREADRPDAADGAGEASPPPVVTAEAEERSLGLTRAQRLLVQHGLASLGHDVGVPDGVLGKRSRSGLRSYQRKKGLPETGYLTAELRDALAALGEEARVEREARGATSAAARAGDEAPGALADAGRSAGSQPRAGSRANLVDLSISDPDDWYDFTETTNRSYENGVLTLGDTNRDYDELWSHAEFGSGHKLEFYAEIPFTREGYNRIGFMAKQKESFWFGTRWERPGMLELEGRHLEGGKRVVDSKYIRGTTDGGYVSGSFVLYWHTDGRLEAEYNGSVMSFDSPKVISGPMHVMARTYEMPMKISNLRLTRLAADTVPKASVGGVFRDCPECPEMVVIPAGAYMMGSPGSEKGRGREEGPVHRVRIPKPFAVGAYEVTFAEWDSCRRAGGCTHDAADNGWGRGDRPVVGVSWRDAQQYVRWLSRKTGNEYRLLSESEWEYAARAGTVTRYWWGDRLGRNRANCEACGSPWDDRETAPVGSFSPNGFGLYDVHGNAREWVEDCWNGGYRGAPSDGSPWTSDGDCDKRVLRSGSCINPPRKLRSAMRVWKPIDRRDPDAGFRVAMTLD